MADREDMMEEGLDATAGDDTDGCRARTTSCVDPANQGAQREAALSRVSGVSVTKSASGAKITSVMAQTPHDSLEEIAYSNTKVIGNGSFGLVFHVTLHNTGEPAAIKKVLQDPRFKNRELQIMKALSHINVVQMHYYFYSSGAKADEVYLNLVMEFLPESLYQLNRSYSKRRMKMPLVLVQLFSYQMFRALSYLHKRGICHRDIKPHNLLVNAELGVLKLCDFGSAKTLDPEKPNVAYICSRYYRAPELIFGNTFYTTMIDVWSSGCVVAELFLGRPLFPGSTAIDQLVEIIKVLGTPTHDQIHAMNPDYQDFEFPQVKAHTWDEIFTDAPASLHELLAHMLVYNPAHRVEMLTCLTHSFFDALRDPETTLEGRPLPLLFDFSHEELDGSEQLVEQLIPAHMRA
eukprot:m.35041 g.35041  ORF g.35041 m.35041 type:complete len:405 (+) comp9843_c0_seq1:449-1663(+)